MENRTMTTKESLFSEIVTLDNAVGWTQAEGFGESRWAFVADLIREAGARDTAELVAEIEDEFQFLLAGIQ